MGLQELDGILRSVAERVKAMRSWGLGLQRWAWDSRFADGWMDGLVVRDDPPSIGVIVMGNSDVAIGIHRVVSHRMWMDDCSIHNCPAVYRWVQRSG